MEGEQRQPAADTSARSTSTRRRRGRLPGWCRLHQTLDGGKTIATDVAEPIHDDVHAIWINPNNPLHVLIGNDGGLAVSDDRAKTWAFLPNLPVGLFYHVSYDMAIPFNVCGGMQDNYNWCGPSEVRGAVGIPTMRGARSRVETVSTSFKIRPTPASRSANPRTATSSASIA